MEGEKPWWLAIVALLLLLIAGDAFSATETEIDGTCGMVISVPGEYVLKNSIENCDTNAGAIVIQGNDITLNLNAKTVSGVRRGDGMRINNGNNVTIMNGTIAGFPRGNGVWSSGGSDIALKDMAIQGNKRGIYLGQNGVLTNCIIENNNITNNTSGGIILLNASNGGIRENTLCENGKYGIQLKNSTGVRIEHNGITSNLGRGIGLTNADENEILENAICYNDRGITADGSSTGNIISRNNLIENSKQASDSDANSWDENFWGSHSLCPAPYVINRGKQVEDSTPLCNPWPGAPPCGCGFSGSICGYKFNDLDGNGGWTLCHNPQIDNDFQEGGLEGWVPDHGNWMMEGGFLKQTDAGTGTVMDALILYEANRYFPLSYRTIAIPVSGNNVFGLVFFAQDANHYYLFRVDGQNKRIGVLRRVGTHFETIVDKPFSDLQELGTSFEMSTGKFYGMKINAWPDSHLVDFCFDELINPGQYQRKDLIPITLQFTLPLEETFGCQSGYIGLWTEKSTVNFDWVFQSTEMGLGDWQINLSGPVSYSVITDSDGSYCFVGLPSGTYFLTETQKPGWIQTFPIPGNHTVTLNENETACCVNFGNKAEP